MAIVLAPHDPTWSASFEAIKANLLTALKDISITGIEHVGSTSIPSILAKPILDIDIIIPSAMLLPSIITALAGLNYVYSGDQGIPDRFAFRYRGEDGLMKRNLYACIQGCLALRNHIAVRDLLRKDEVLRKKYEAVKVGLARVEGITVDEYSMRKTEVLGEILEKAGFSKKERDEIKGNNQL